MPRITAAGGAATAALVVALGIAGPAAATEHAGHAEHGTESVRPEDHSKHSSPAEEEGAGHDGGQGDGADTVSDQTRVSVLGGFGAVNAAVIGSAFLLRRRDRRTGKQPPTNRGSHR